MIAEYEKILNLPGESPCTLSEFLGFSDDKITEILKKSGSTPSEIQFTFRRIEELRREQLKAIVLSATTFRSAAIVPFWYPH